jgi:glycosyltransferase involved in cell wall biosynthesis
MKVLFVTTESLMDHSFTMICELRKHVEHDVIFTAKELSPENKDFCNTLNAKFVKRTRFKNPLSIFREIKLLRYIKKQNADLVWFNTLSLLQSILLKLFIKRPLINAHDIEFHPEESDYHGILAQKITVRFFKECIAVMSYSQAEIFETKYGFKPYILQLPVIDYYEASARYGQTEQKSIQPDFMHDDKTAIRFLFFGSILPYKGIERLIKAAGILEKKNLNFELNVYGKIKYNREKLLNKINEIKNINLKDEFIDYKEVYNVYQANDVIIIPYLHVSQCGPLLIGYNQNVPCITSDLPGFREYTDDGKSGLIFNNSAEGLAEKMEELINSPGKIKDMKNYISEKIKPRFAMPALADSYIKIFHEHIRVTNKS